MDVQLYMFYGKCRYEIVVPNKNGRIEFDFFVFCSILSATTAKQSCPFPFFSPPIKKEIFQ